MKWRKALSLTLAMSMIAGPMAGAVPKTAEAAEERATEQGSNVNQNYVQPWSNGTIPKLSAKKTLNVGFNRFTHKEWTGQEYEDVDGVAVKGAEVYGINREEDSSLATGSVVYDSVEKAINGAVNYQKEDSDYVQFLTGEEENNWSLVVLQNQDLAMGEDYKNFYQIDYKETAEGWKSKLQLPCSWTRQGFDFSIYTNWRQPWQTQYDKKVTVPEAPVVYNPVGLYRKIFTVNDEMRAADGRIYLSFQGVESAYYVYVNGKEVGYSEDSYSPHSFDITDYLNEEGKNLLAVKVHKFCDGTWMEDQDMFYDGGIFRDVYLYSAPLVHIQDYTVVTDLDENYENAELQLKVTMANSSTEEVSGYKVDAKLYDAEGNVFVNDITLDPGTIPAAKSGEDGKAEAFTSKMVYNPELWSAETPNLYTMVLSVYDSNTGAYLGSTSQQLGFREIEFVSSQVDENGERITEDSEYTPITINGKPILLKGTNRHDTDPVYGKHVPKETMEKDIFLMKEYNLNALRTSHYSNDEYLYYLCDKYGIYMMGETNLESHYLNIFGNQAGQAKFKKLAMDRTITAFKRLKNRTAIVMWSTGNENHNSKKASYADGTFYQLTMFFKENDPTRPIHAESSRDANGVDMGSNMYPSISEVQDWAKRDMPYVLCEYEHAHGNAIGYMDEYWDAIRSSDNMLGGFIWDWVDQARLLDIPEDGYDYYSEEFAHTTLYKDESKGKFFAYGGDSGESPNDGTFCVNGLVSPDRDVQPELYEVKYQYQSFWFTATDKQLQRGKVEVYNENNFLDMDNYDVTWTLKEDDKVIGSGVVTENVAPRERKDLYIPYREVMPADKKDGAEYYLEFSVTMKEGTDWAEAGHEVAYEQFALPVMVEQAARPAVNTNVTVDENGEDAILVSGTGFSFEIDKATGTLKNYVYKEETLMKNGPVPNYWRATRDNNDASYHDKNWRKVVENITAKEISVGTNEAGQKVITVDLSSEAQPDLIQQMVYTVDGSGAVTVEMTMDASKTTLNAKKYIMRVGTQMELPEGYENLEWYGAGPVESFSDRIEFARIGRYASTVSEMFYPFVFTQDTGNLVNTKWMTVTNPENKNALAVTTPDSVEVSALHFTAEDLEAAGHPYELAPRKETIVSVNYGSTGAGCESWGAGMLDKYGLKRDQVYNYQYTLIPYKTGENVDVMDITRGYRTVASVSDEITKTAKAEMLKMVYDAYAALNTDGYTEASAAALKEALAAGAEIIENENAKEVEIEAAIAEIMSAASALKADTTDLEETIKAAQAAADAAQEVADAAQAAADAAQAEAEANKAAADAAKKLAETAQDAADAAKLQAAAAVKAAVKATKASMLKMICDTYTAIDKAAYTKESAEALEKALAAGKAVQANTASTEAQIEAAIQEIMNAAAALKMDTTDLKTAIDAANAAVEAAQKVAEEAKKEAANNKFAAETAQKAAEAAQKAAEEAKEKYEEQSKVTVEQQEELAKLTAQAEEAKKAAEAAQKAAEEAKKAAEELKAEAESDRAKAAFTSSKVTVKSVKSSKKKQMKVTWKAVAGAEGYVVEYATNAGFKKAKKATVNAAALQKNIKGLKSKKKSYVRVRAFATMGGEKVYTNYSTKKKVTVK